MVRNLSDLSITDLKALLDYVREYKIEKIEYAEEEGLNIKDDVEMERLSLLEFQIRRKLDNIVLKYTGK